MNPIFQAALGSLLRWALAVGAGWLVQRGIWTEAEALTYVSAAVLAVLSLLWSLWQKYRQRIKFLTALELPKGSTEGTVAATIAIGEGAALLPAPAKK